MQIKLLNHRVLKEGENIASCNFRSMVFKDVYHIFEEDYIDGHWRIFKRTSNDGINLSERIGPLFELGSKGDFDELGQADPTVIYSGGKWQMWFDAMNSNYYWDQIGYAISEDGDAWINCGPVLSRGMDGTWDGKSIHHPVVLKYNIYYLYYSGCEYNDGEQENFNVKHIGLAYSDDGINWTKEKNNPIITTGNDWDSKYIRPSCPVFIRDKWFMFYWGFNGTHSMGIASSDNLVHWEKAGQILSGIDEHTGITASQVFGTRIYYTTWDNKNMNIADIVYE